jgi:hypothetical protein
MNRISRNIEDCSIARSQKKAAGHVAKKACAFQHFVELLYLDTL